MLKILLPTFLIVAALVAAQFFLPRQSTATMFTLENDSLILVSENSQQTRATNVAARLYDQREEYALYAEKITEQSAAGEYTGGGDLWLINKSGTIHKRLVTATTITDALIAPRTQKIFCLTNDGKLFSTDFDGNDIAALADKAVSPSISADEKFLIFQKLNSAWRPDDYYNENQGLAIYDLAAGREKIITANNEDFSPIFSPKATKIIFNSLSAEGLVSLFVVDIDGNNRTQLTNIGQKFVNAATIPTPADRPIWSDDGSSLVYESDNEIWFVEFDADFSTITRAQRIAYGKSPRWIDDKTVGIITNDKTNNISRISVN
jgi:tricorn protease-like protein